MKLARKFTVALVIGILIVLGGNSTIRVKREIELFETDSTRDSRLLGRVLGGAVQRVWSTVGEEQALQLVADADEREGSVRIRWLGPDAEIFAPGSAEGPALGEYRSVQRLDELPDGTDALYTYVPVVVSGSTRGAIEIRDSLLRRNVYIRNTIAQAIITTSILVILCGCIALWLGVLFVGRPVGLLIEKARRIGCGDLSGRLNLNQKDEIGELGEEMNTMCDLLDRANRKAAAEARGKLAAVEQLRHADRLSTVGKLATGIAHELGTPLNVVTGRAQLIARDSRSSEEERQHATIITEQARRMTAIIRQVLDFARRQDAHKSRHNLREVMHQATKMVETLAQKASVSVEIAEESEIHANIDAGQVHQALTNLLVNAIQAMPNGGVVQVGLRLQELEPPPDHGGARGEYICLYVQDHGVGMTPEVRARVFEPFFTTKQVGDGTGLGLSVAYGIAKDHGGWIGVESELGRGSRFSICLPQGEGG